MNVFVTMTNILKFYSSEQFGWSSHAQFPVGGACEISCKSWPIQAVFNSTVASKRRRSEPSELELLNSDTLHSGQISKFLFCCFFVSRLDEQTCQGLSAFTACCGVLEIDIVPFDRQPQTRYKNVYMFKMKPCTNVLKRNKSSYTIIVRSQGEWQIIHDGTNRNMFEIMYISA